MNLSGPNQELNQRYQGQGEGAGIPVLFRSRPFTIPHPIRSARDDLRAACQRSAPFWHVAVWDEVRASADGVLTRRIRILITDEPQFSPGKPAQG